MSNSERAPKICNICGDQSSSLSDALIDLGLYEAAPAIDRSRRHRSTLRRYASGEPRRCAGDVKVRDREDGVIKVVLRLGRQRTSLHRILAEIFFIFSNRTGCFGSLPLAAAVTLALLAFGAALLNPVVRRLSSYKPRRPTTVGTARPLDRRSKTSICHPYRW